MLSGINQFYNLLSLDPSLFKVYYDFTGAAGATIPSVSGGKPLFSGAFSAGTNSSGHFTGQNVRITNETGLFSSDWTMFFVYEKTDSSHGVLFSNYHGEAVKSGFAIGVNDANKLYFETFSATGPRVAECDLGLGAKNAVAVTKAGNGIYFSLFDWNSRKVEAESFNIDSSFILNTTRWYLGDAVNPPSYFSGRAFRGYMSSFCYFNNSLMPYQIERLFSGFFTQTPDSGIFGFGRDGVAFLSPVDASDSTELFTFPSGTLKTNIGKLAVFDSAHAEFFTTSPVGADGLNSYVNGVAQIPSGYSISGTFYNPVYFLSGNLVVSGQELFANGVYSSADDLQYDVVSGARNFKFVPASYTDGVVSFSSFGSHVFLNGIKMRSGIDYVPSGASTVINSSLTGISGLLFTFPADTDPTKAIVGSFNVTTGTRFAKGTTQLWRNGVRQALGVNYVEIACIDLLVGSGTFPSKPVLFGNLQLFWN